MTDIAKPDLQPGGVHRLWRTLAIGLVIGICAHAVFSRQTPAAPAFAVRGDPLPAPDPRLDLVLDSVDFDHVPFGEALNHLTDRAGINLIVAWDVLHHSAGIERDAPLTLHLKKVTLASALDAALLCVDVAHAVSWNEFGGIVHITTFENEPPQYLLMRFYDVQSILDKGYPQVPTTGPQEGQKDGPSDRMDDLKKLITDNVYTTTWKDNGGDVGTISSYPGTLLVIQTTQAHRQIEALLRRLDNQH